MKAGIKTIALTLLAGAATVGAQPREQGRRPHQRDGFDQQQRQRCPACVAPRRGGHRQRQFENGRQRQTHPGRRGQSARRQPTVQQRRQWMQNHQRQQFQGRPQQFQGRPQRQQFQGRPQQFQGQPPQQLTPEQRQRIQKMQQLTPEQRQHIQKMQQRFRQDVQRYLSGKDKKGHGKPQGNQAKGKKPGKPKHKPSRPSGE